MLPPAAIADAAVVLGSFDTGTCRSAVRSITSMALLKLCRWMDILVARKHRTAPRDRLLAACRRPCPLVTPPK